MPVVAAELEILDKGQVALEVAELELLVAQLIMELPILAVEEAVKILNLVVALRVQDQAVQASSSFHTLTSIMLLQVLAVLTVLPLL